MTSSLPPSPGRRGGSTRTLAGDLRRLDARLAPRWLTWVVLGLNVLILLTTTAPFALWHTVGPSTFDDLGSGGVQPAEIDPDEMAAADAVSDRIAPDIPLALGPNVRVTLLFSVGSRGMSAEEAERLRVNDLASRGADGLTDTMMLLLADPDSGRAALLSIPRDLWLFERGHRLNESFNRYGTQGFVEDVSHVTGLPVHHVVRVNFTAFAELVDRIGGVALSVDRPLADLNSVLYVPEPGCWRFTGADALGWVRSRHTLTRRDGAWRLDASASDQGRMARQRQLLGAAWEQLRGPRLLARIPDLLTVARHGLVVDQDLGLQALRDLAGAFGQLSAGTVESYTVPTVGRRIGRAAAQVVQADAARDVFRRLRSFPGGNALVPLATGRTVLAAPLLAGEARAAATLDVDPDCTLESAWNLPAPFESLAAIARDEAPDSWSPPEEEPSETPSPEPSSEPSPSPSPTEEPTDDPGGLPSEPPSDNPLPFPPPLP